MDAGRGSRLAYDDVAATMSSAETESSGCRPWSKPPPSMDGDASSCGGDMYASCGVVFL
jgi:hypothetical protein